MHEMLRNLAKEITGIKLGKQWPGRFLKKYNKDLISCYTTGIGAARKRADSAFNYALYFEFRGRKFKEYAVQPENMHNMDAKGFLIRMLSKGKRVFSS
jgi:hypothetical protein